MSQISEDAVRATLATVREQLTEEITEAIEKAVREERAAVVAWLREVRDTSETAYASDDLDYAIAVIERGGHRHKEEG